MNANEIRIGNWVEVTDHYANPPKSFIQVSSIINSGIELNSQSEYEDWVIEPSYKFDHVNGVPLTPEILSKCGFKDEGLQCDFSNGIMDISKYDDGYMLTFHGSEGIGSGLKYLHELQNLYFFLYGKELEIKL